eukprot:1436678-Amphidinium_carterae.4
MYKVEFTADSGIPQDWLYASDLTFGEALWHTQRGVNEQDLERRHNSPILGMRAAVLLLQRLDHREVPARICIALRGMNHCDHRYPTPLNSIKLLSTHNAGNRTRKPDEAGTESAWQIEK